MDSEWTSPASSLVKGSARVTGYFPTTNKLVMNSSKHLKGRRRGSYGERAPLATLSPGLREETESVNRKRGRRGGGGRHRAGARKHQKKTERLRKKYLLVCYWNCRSARRRGCELERLVYECDVLLLQETKVTNFSCPGYDSYNNPASQTHHGQAILVRHGIDHRLMDAGRWNREDREVQIVECTVGGRKWILVNVYIGNNSATSVEEWEFLEELDKLGERVIVLGDFNARSKEWGNLKENIQGTALDQALVEHNFNLLNQTEMTRLAQREGEEDSNIDLALVKTGNETYTQWHSLPDHGSDHLPCSVRIGMDGKAGKRKIKHPFTYNREGSTVLDKIRRKAWSKKTQRPNFVQPPYWSDELEELWRQKRRSTRTWQKIRKSGTTTDAEKEEAKEQMKKDGHIFKAQSNEAKQEKWEEFATEVSSEKALHKFWKLYGKMKGQQKETGGRTIIEQGKRLDTDEAKGQAFLERYIQQTHQGNMDERRDIREMVGAAVPDVPYDFPVTAEEVVQVIKSTKDSAAGPDGVRYTDWKEAAETDIDSMVEEYNSSITNGHIPIEWLHSYLTPIPKPGKDHTSLGGYRIITMQNTYGKILEKIVAGRLARHLENKGLLPDGLGSYRPGWDTCINTATLAYDVYEGFQRKQETVVVAIDLEDAYNRVDYGKLMDLLMDCDFDVWMLRWIAEALCVRNVALKTGKWVSDPCEIAPGLPQGSALSPVLYNVYTSRIAATGIQGSGKTLTFADDITIYAQGDDRLVSVRQLQNRLDEVAEWCAEYKSVINPAKAQVIWCSIDNNIVQDYVPPVTFDYEIIERCSELKYLGIIFDRALSFSQHTDNVIAKAKKGIGAVRAMASAHIQQHVLVLMMQLVVLSVIDYGLGCLTLAETQLKKLERLQNEGMRAVLGCTKDTPIICMRYLLDLSSIRVRHKLAQAKMYLKVMENKRHPLHQALRETKGDRIRRGKSWMAEAEDTLRQVCELEDIVCGKEWQEVGAQDRSLTEVLITMGRERRECAPIVTEQEIRALIADHSKPDDPVIYTDGSVRRGEQSGWGFVAYIKNNIVHQASGATTKTTSSMRMEMEAITKALKWIHGTRPRSPHIVIITDSQSVLRKVEKGLLRSEWLETILATQVRSITWIFCPGHAGVKGNEVADKLAGNAAMGGEVKLHKPDVLKELEKHLREKEDRGLDEHHAIVRMQEMGVKRGEGRKNGLAGRERRWHNQVCTGTISSDTLRAILVRGTEHVWTCPQCSDVVIQDK